MNAYNQQESAVAQTTSGNSRLVHTGLVAFSLILLAQSVRSILNCRILDRLNDLAAALAERFERSGHLVDVNVAIAILQGVVKVTPERYSPLPSRLNNLGNALQARFERTGDLSDIDRSLAARRRAMILTPDGHTHRPWFLSSLGNTLRSHFSLSGDIASINEAIIVQVEAVASTPVNHPDRPGRLGNLGMSLLRRFQSTAQLDDLTQSTSVLRMAVDLTPENHATLPTLLNALGNSYICLFGGSGDLSHITESIALLRRAVRISPEGHAQLIYLLCDLGGALRMLFLRSGHLPDAAQALSLLRKAVQHVPEDDAQLPRLLTDLGATFEARFVRTGDPSDIAQAIEAKKKAVDSTPPGHVDLPLRLGNLANSFLSRFTCTGNPSDIAESVSALRRAVQMTPEGHGVLPGLLNGLASALGSRFEQGGHCLDIADAVSSQQKAVELTHKENAELPVRLANLATLLLLRFDRLGDFADLDQCISTHREAIEKTPRDDVFLSLRIFLLGNAFRIRFENGGTIDDITQAISLQQRSMVLTPEDHGRLPDILENLGISFAYRFARTHSLSDIDESISALQRAVDLTPRGHALRPSRLSHLGSSLHSRFSLNGDSKDLHSCMLHYKSAATDKYGPPKDRLKAAMKWARVMNHTQDSPEILSAFETSIDLMALVAGLDKPIPLRYAHLQHISSMALEASAVACRLGRPDRALEWLEHGQCVVWNQLSSLRTPLDKLRVEDGELAEGIMEVSKRLDRAGLSRGQANFAMTEEEKISLDDEARIHLALAEQFNGLLREARSKPGFETLLQPLPCSNLLESLPSTGYIVVINVDESRCDAIALSASFDGPLHIPLPDFSLKKARKYSADLKGRLKLRGFRMRGDAEEPVADQPDTGALDEPLTPDAQEQEPDQDLVRKVLQGLWKSLLKPILEALGLPKADLSSGKRPPRVWWCPTGPLSFLPIHAAGIYFRNKAAECVLDYVISSYTPTVTALLSRVKNDGPVDRGARGLFLTCQPDAPDAKSIPKTKTEVRSVCSSAQELGLRVLKLEGDEVSPEACLQHMENFSCVHLACHASQNAADPLQSQFLFHAGSLALSAIMQRTLKNADLVFMSACQTGTGDEKLPDEAVYLAAGMLAAGYRRAVATMWTIRDQHASGVSEEFYRYLWSHREKSDSDCFDGKLSAYALHHTIQKLRLDLKELRNSETTLLSWIPYVHFGY